LRDDGVPALYGVVAVRSFPQLCWGKAGMGASNYAPL
jgi:hypothetical protein